MNNKYMIEESINWKFIIKNNKCIGLVFIPPQNKRKRNYTKSMYLSKRYNIKIITKYANRILKENKDLDKFKSIFINKPHVSDTCIIYKIPNTDICEGNKMNTMTFSISVDKIDNTPYYRDDSYYNEQIKLDISNAMGIVTDNPNIDNFSMDLKYDFKVNEEPLLYIIRRIFDSYCVFHGDIDFSKYNVEYTINMDNMGVIAIKIYKTE